MRPKFYMITSSKGILQVLVIILVFAKVNCDDVNDEDLSIVDKSPIQEICEETCQILYKEQEFVKSICEGHCINSRCYKKVYSEYVIDFLNQHFKNIPEDYATLEYKRQMFIDCWKAEKESGADTVEEDFYLVKDTMKMFSKESLHQNLLQNDIARQLHQVQEESLKGLNNFRECYDDCVKLCFDEFDFFIDALCSSKCYDMNCYQKIFQPYILDLDLKIFQNVPNANDSDAYHKFTSDLANQFDGCIKGSERYYLNEIENEDFSLNLEL